jgi:chromosome segregation ATPase
MNAELALVFALVSCLADVALVVGFLAAQKKTVEEAARQAGVREQKLRDLEQSLERAHTKIREIDVKLLQWITDQAALAADMKHLLTTTTSIESKLDRHLERP